MGFRRPQLREVSFNAFYQAMHLRDRMSREDYKYVLYPQQFALQFDHLTTQTRASFVPEAFDKFFPFDPVLNSAVLTFIEYIMDQQARRCM